MRFPVVSQFGSKEAEIMGIDPQSETLPSRPATLTDTNSLLPLNIQTVCASLDLTCQSISRPEVRVGGAEAIAAIIDLLQL